MVPSNGSDVTAPDEPPEEEEDDDDDDDDDDDEELLVPPVVLLLLLEDEELLVPPVVLLLLEDDDEELLVPPVVLLLEEDDEVDEADDDDEPPPLDATPLLVLPVPLPPSRRLGSSCSSPSSTVEPPHAEKAAHPAIKTTATSVLAIRQRYEVPAQNASPRDRISNMRGWPAAC
ncbi:MAG: hypothetical protein HY904_21190 [Deltaproteobacteria bacterium]|nr:hypothetical protein [Deltaproteobacteria bacterium]